MAGRIARASGCSLQTSNATTSSSTRSRRSPSAATSTTAGWLRPRGPALSRSSLHVAEGVQHDAALDQCSVLAAPFASTTATGMDRQRAGRGGHEHEQSTCARVAGAPKKLPTPAKSAAVIMLPRTGVGDMRSAER